MEFFSKVKTEIKFGFLISRFSSNNGCDLLAKLIPREGYVKFFLMSKNKAFIILFLLFLIIFYANSSLFSQEDTPITVIANYKEKFKEMVFATGNVEVHYKDITLLADRVEINTETKDVFAQGNVSLLMPDEQVSAEEIHLNLDSSRGEIQEGFGMIQPDIIYQAESIERKDDNVYSFRKAKITSCNQPNPRWQFSCSKANFKKDDYIEMWGAVFTIKKVPIFYLPYLRYPLDKERSTGFLMPQVGYTGQKGFTFTQSFFWAMKRNMDATLNVDYYSAKGMGGGLEYRYMFSEGVRGQLNAYRFQFKREPGEEASSGAYLFRFNHTQTLPLDFSLVADVDYSSSFEFLREFDNDFKRAVVSNRSSQVYLSKSWSYFNFNARVSRFETYTKTTDTSMIRHSLPEISIRSSKIRLFSPLYFSFSSSFNRWEYGTDTQYEQDTQQRSQMASFQPQLTLPFAAVPWFTFNSSLYSNLTYYFQSYEPGTTVITDEALFAPQYGLNLELTGPVFLKIFYDAQGQAKLKHIIEPNFSYRYESPIDDPDRIIDYRRYFRYHEISYGLTNRVLVKKGGMSKEIFALGLRQTFYLSPEDSPLSLYTIDGEIPEFSDIKGYLRFYPASNYSIDASAAYNPHYNTFSSLRVGASLESDNNDSFLRVNWYKSINPYFEGVIYNRHQLNFYGGLKIPRLSLDAEAELDYNIQEKELQYTGLALVYHYQCIDIRAELKVFYFRERPETQFKISIGLGNIGKTVDFLGGLGF